MLQIQEMNISSAYTTFNRWAQFQASGVQMKGRPNLFAGSLHRSQNTGLGFWDIQVLVPLITGFGWIS